MRPDVSFKSQFKFWMQKLEFRVFFSLCITSYTNLRKNYAHTVLLRMFYSKRGQVEINWTCKGGDFQLTKSVLSPFLHSWSSDSHLNQRSKLSFTVEAIKYICSLWLVLDLKQNTRNLVFNEPYSVFWYATREN